MTKTRPGHPPGYPRPVTSLSDGQISPIATLDSILARLGAGEIEPSEAEAEVKALGLPPLAAQPTDVQFDPRTKPEWSLPMALTWIVSRDLEMVRWADNDFRDRVTVPRTIGGCPECEADEPQPHDKCRHKWIIAPLEPMSLATAQMEFIARGEASILADAKLDLWRLLISGKLTAHALNSESPPLVVEIPKIHWPRLRPGSDPETGLDYLRFEHGPATPAYRDVAIPSGELLKEFPPKGHRNTQAAATERRKWLMEKIRQSPQKRSVAKADFVRESVDTHGLSENAADLLWKDCVSTFPEWRKRGPNGPRKGTAAATR